MVRQALIFVWVATAAACSATKEIASSASVASSAAHSISERADFIVLHSTQPEIVAAGKSIKADAEIIVKESHQISVAVSGVKDIVPFWATLIQWVLIVAAMVGAIILLMQTGIGQALRAALGWIPRRDRMDADLAKQAMDASDPATMREYVAARRARDPMFNAAFKKSGGVK